jgi:hypothetical protein
MKMSKNKLFVFLNLGLLFSFAMIIAEVVIPFPQHGKAYPWNLDYYFVFGFVPSYILLYSIAVPFAFRSSVFETVLLRVFLCISLLFFYAIWIVFAVILSAYLDFDVFAYGLGRGT